MKRKKSKSKADKNDESHEAYTGKNMPDRNSEEAPERQGPDLSKMFKKGSSIEPDKDETGAQGGYGHGNQISKGSEGAQGYGKYEE